MNPELQQLKQQVAELLEWKRQREIQQLSFPVDLASKNALGVTYGEGPGSSSLTQNKNLTGDPETITVPAPYARSVFVLIDNVRYEIPSLI